MALTDNLVSYWKMDEASGTRSDAHASNDLTDNNTVGSGTGIINNGADFELDNSEYLSITDGSQSGLDITGDFSISLWASIETFTGGDKCLVAKWKTTTNDRSYDMCITSNTTVRLRTSTDGSASSSASITTATINTGTLYHWVFTKSGTTATLYRDGSSVSTGTVDSSQFNGAADFTVGAVGNPANYMDGIIDEVGIWDRALTSDEVSDLYNGGSGLSYDNFTSAFTPRQPLIF